METECTVDLVKLPWRTIESAPDNTWIFVGEPGDLMCFAQRVKWSGKWVWDMGDDHREDGYFTHWVPGFAPPEA